MAAQLWLASDACAALGCILLLYEDVMRSGARLRDSTWSCVSMPA